MQQPQPVPSLLVDARNYHAIFPALIEKIKNAPYCGIDIETHNGRAHDGIKLYNKQKGKNAFDIRRTVITGISFYPKGDTCAYYVNLNQLDKDNRLPIEAVKQLLVSKLWIIHNAKFELTMLMAVYGIDLSSYICTYQLAVSAFGPDNYDIGKFCATPLGEIGKLLPEISRTFENYDINKQPTPTQAELIGKVCGKSSDAAHSYNGWVKEIAYGYGLKKLVKSLFNYDMEHYDECLMSSNYAKQRDFIMKSKDPQIKTLQPYFEEEPHMGHLTGEEVVSYGADDSYWCVQVYEWLLEFILANSPEVVPTFLNQENPMAKIFSKITLGGLRINEENVYKKRDEERVNLAHTLRDIKKHIRELLPFKCNEYPETLMKSETWYSKDPEKYRQKIREFAYSPDFDDSPEGIKNQIYQVNGGAANSYGEDNKTGIINLSHYMPQRVLFYDLMGFKGIRSKGKLQSDKNARGKMIEECEKDSPQHLILECLNKISQVDQVCKLYLNPYLLLIDPETKRVYPDIGSDLATRRMSMSNPNGQQLAKGGDSSYIRGFYLPDRDDHVIMSSDWSNMELVIPAELSGDPEFLKCFGQIPYEDLHAIAAAAMLELTDEEFASLKDLPEDVDNIRGIHFKNERGEILKPKDFWKWARKNLGKGANFSYAFSGALSNLQEKLGWSDEYHWAKVEAYRNRFNVFEEWRLGIIADAKAQGFVQLPDGHKRYRFEATQMWRQIMTDKFLATYDSPGVRNFLQKFLKLTQTRANNQAVNALVQGTAAALTKRSMIRLSEEITKRGWDDGRVRIMMPIHDEIVASVHKDLVLEYRKLIRQVMCEQPWLFHKVILNCSVSMGRTFEPFNLEKAPLGQIELDEAPHVDFIDQKFWGKSMDDEAVKRCLDYLFE